MARDLNQWTGTGRLTKDIELRTTTSGKTVGQFTLAVSRQGKDDGADFFDVTVWEKTAEIIEKYTQKGSRILVSGRLQQESWEDKTSGQKRSRVVIIGNDITLLDSKSDNQQATKPKDVVIDDIDDKPLDLSEIPF